MSEYTLRIFGSRVEVISFPTEPTEEEISKAIEDRLGPAGIFWALSRDGGDGEEVKCGYWQWQWRRPCQDGSQ